MLSFLSFDLNTAIISTARPVSSLSFSSSLLFFFSVGSYQSPLLEHSKTHLALNASIQNQGKSEATKDLLSCCNSFSHLLTGHNHHCSIPNMATFFKSTKTMGTSSSDPLSVLQILWAALQLPTKTTTLFFPLLLLSLLFSSSLFYFSNTSICPILHDMVSKLSIFLKDPRGPAPPDLFTEIEKDLKEFAGLASGIVVVSFFTSLFLLVATVYAFAMAYANSSLTPKGLLLRVARRWYQTLVTRLYVVLLTLGFAVLSSLAVGTVMLVSGVSEFDSGSGASLASLGVFLYFYLVTRWSMSLVITVVEETWGIGALSWSVELFIGNKKRGTLLTLILMAVQMVIYGAFGLLMASQPPKPVDDQTKIGFILAAASAAWEMYSMAAYTVFYYECRKSHGLEETVGEGFIYASLPTAAVVKIEAIY